MMKESDAAESTPVHDASTAPTGTVSDHVPVMIGPATTTREAIPTTDVFYAMFAGAAGRAAIFEIKARFFVDAVPELSGSLTSSLEPLMKDLVTWVARETPATLEERDKLSRCARLRNKLFHAEFSRVRGQLVSLDTELAKESVMRFTWTGPGELTAEGFVETMTAGGVAMSTTKTKEGSLFGWMIEASASGAFGAAASVFDEGADLLSRILHDWTHAKMLAEKLVPPAGPP